MTEHDPIKVLLIEDDRIDIEYARRGVTRHKLSLELTVVGDGVEALEILDKGNTANELSPWLIMLDLNMPKMNGFEFLEELKTRSNRDDCVVFVLTTSSDTLSFDKAHSFDIAGYINKRNFHWGQGDFQRLVGIYKKRLGARGI